MPDQIDIRSTRLKLKMSQAAFAEAMGVDQSTVSAWETKGLPRNELTREAAARRIAALLESRAA